LVNTYISQNYSKLVSIARTAIFKSGKRYEPEAIISLLYLHLLEAKDIKNLEAYCVRYIYQSCSWNNSEIAKENNSKEQLTDIDLDVIQEECEFVSCDVDLKILNKYELTLYTLYYVERKKIPTIISELKVKLTYSMIWRDVEKIRNKLKEQWNLLNSQE